MIEIRRVYSPLPVTNRGGAKIYSFVLVTSYKDFYNFKDFKFQAGDYKVLGVIDYGGGSVLILKLGYDEDSIKELSYTSTT